MKRINFLIAVFWLGIQVCSAQKAEQTLPVTGKPILTVFSSYKAGLGNANSVSGFNLDRAFVGYEAFLPKGFSAKVVLNVETYKADDGTTKFGSYLKNAQVNWKYGGFSASLGLVNLKQFSEQENAWGHRYIFKSFQEEYGFSYCEDIGLVASYDFSPVVSADIAFTNGEGRKIKNENNKYRYGAGVSVRPVKGLLLRAYADVYSHPDEARTEQVLKDQYSLALFAGYTHRYFSIGAEFNKSYNHLFASGRNLTGYSIYSTVPVYKKLLQLYGRFDLLKSSNDWNSQKDGNMLIIGMDYQPMRYFRISPNFQSWKGIGQRRNNYLLISVEVKI
ncbi:hypothetical protein ACR77X_10710 [Bacteroides salyersiae]|uniref:hypothetical protein n=1 Tax=Bacteroides salyersiae TaxID=291644 RepID=UPI003DA2BFD3